MPKLNSICKLILISDPIMRKFNVFAEVRDLRKFIVNGSLVMPEYMEMIPEYLHGQLREMVDCNSSDINTYKLRAFSYNLILALGNQESKDMLMQLTDFYSCLIYNLIMGEVSMNGESTAELLAMRAIYVFGEYYGTNIDQWRIAISRGYISVFKHRLIVSERYD